LKLKDTYERSNTKKCENIKSFERQLTIFCFYSLKGKVLYFWLLEEGVLQSGVRREGGRRREVRGELREQSVPHRPEKREGLAFLLPGL
jgi:hypothetical protein